jgi:hypothetical protein
MYDIFFIGDSANAQYKKLKQRFITAKHASSVLEAKQKSLTSFLWIVYHNIEINSDFDFDYKVDEYDKEYTHVFLNGNFYDGVALLPKHGYHSPGEIRERFFVNKKIIQQQASVPMKPQYDIVFISYNEPSADKNYSNIKERFPRAQRVHGVKGIHQAHIAAAKLCDTEMVWIVDGDAIVLNDFDFSYVPEHHNREAVHVWRSKNPINDMVYGYGGIKLFPTQATIDMDTSKPDMTTSISGKFVAVKKVSNITAFNTGEFETWKSAFRECCKLSSKVIDRQKDDETNKRLHTWCTVGIDRTYGKYAIAGAKAGAAYGARNQGNLEALKLINDFDWLQEQFDAANI